MVIWVIRIIILGIGFMGLWYGDDTNPCSEQSLYQCEAYQVGWVDGGCTADENLNITCS